MDWYESISSDAVVEHSGRVERVLMYRDIEHAIDHAPEVAAPWALMVQYLLPFDPDTARAIWDGFVPRFIVDDSAGAYVQIVPGSGTVDVRATCLATWLAAEVGDDRRLDALLGWVDASLEPRHDDTSGEFAYWFNLDEPFPRGQWNNAIMNLFVAPAGTWSRLLD